jgi:hypothetical protein
MEKGCKVMTMLEWLASLLCRVLHRVLSLIPNSPTRFWVLSRFAADPSQNGESRIVEMARETLATRGRPVPATFLELGANHPFFLSNTWYLEHRCGFQGVSVDPLPKYEALFRASRPKTQFVRAAVVPLDRAGTDVRIYNCDNDALSTTDLSEADRLRSMNLGGSEIIARGVPYEELVRRPEFTSGLGVLFLDVESHELQLAILREVVASDRKPRLICVETLEFMGDQRDFRGDYLEVLGPAGYREMASTILNTIYAS